MSLKVKVDKIKKAYQSAGVKELGDEEKLTVLKDLTNSYVIQRHESKHPHFDLRIEHGGKMLSWAVPKGFPKKVGGKALAIKQPDHEIEYATFEGVIPEGEYGAGKVSIVDSGKIKNLKVLGNYVSFNVTGKLIKGSYVLVKISDEVYDKWLLRKVDD